METSVSLTQNTPEALLFEQFSRLKQPSIVAVTGKKRSGKDYFADSLAFLGYKKVHIADQWLREICATKLHIDIEQYYRDKAVYREFIQREAVQARHHDPLVLVRKMVPLVREAAYHKKKLVVTGVRFLNEVNFFYQHDALVCRVSVPDEVRRQRFLASGELLTHFDDPFEAEIPRIKPDLELRGDTPAFAQLSALVRHVELNMCA